MSPRAKSFEPEVALEEAKELFWFKGYDGTSMSDLVDQMKINRFSIYDTFGDKRQLFLSACQRYVDWIDEVRRNTIDEAATGLEGIDAFFSWCIDFLSTPGGRRGCMILNTVMEKALHDEEIAAYSREAIEGTEHAILRGLQRAKEEGQLAPGQEPAAVASVFLFFLYGMVVYNKAFFDKGAMIRNKELFFASWFGRSST